MKIALIVCFLAAALVGHAQPSAILEILKGVKPGDSQSIRTAENALVKLGKAQLPNLKIAMAKASDAEQRAIGGAILRLSWGMNPMDKAIAWLKQKKASPGAEPQLIAGQSLIELAPKCAFYALHYREWPMAFVPSAPFKPRNILAVTSTGAVQLFTDPKKLAPFYGQQIGSLVRQQIPMATAAWLTLSVEFSQDGFFIFKIPIDQIRVHSGTVGFVAIGKATVDPKGGDSGELVANVNFWPNRNREFDVKDITEKRTIQAGVRPVCQALLLLDPNPTVRRMAERDLLVMGPIIKPYLDEKRKEAPPELQKAIDAIWQKILRGER